MIYALKLLAMVLLVTWAAAYLFKPAFKDLFTPTEYKRAWNVLAVTVVCTYLCKFPALFLLVFAAIALYSAALIGRGPLGKLTIYLLLACAVPPIRVTLGGVGDINYLLSLDTLRVLSIVLLSWAALEIFSQKAAKPTVPFFWVDLLIVAYQVFRIVLMVPHSSVTALARSSVEAALDILLPYFVITRSIRSMADLRFATGHFLIGIAFAASVAVAETLYQHNLYSGLQSIYGITWQLSYQLMRGNLLRVQSVTPQPIVLAFMMLFAIAIAYWLKGLQWRRGRVAALFGAFAIALVATFSRGQWLAAGVMGLSIFAMHRMSASAFRALLVATVLTGIGLKLADADKAVMSALGALFGSAEADLSTIEYRRQLLDVSLGLIKQSPWFGVPNYASQMQSLKQGEGIIDIVNSYLAIMLDAGVVGLAIYLLPFMIVVNRLIGAMRRGADGRLDHGSRFAVAFVALILGCLFAILSASTWSLMPMLLTVAVALPTAWLGLSPEERNAEGAKTDLELDLPDDPLRSRRMWIGGRPS